MLAFAPWRTNPNFIGAILVAADLPPRILGDYHIFSTGSPAYNTGAASKAVPGYQAPPATLPAPAADIDDQPRPATLANPVDIGADEISAAADLSITKTDGATSVTAGAAVTYTIVVSNAGPNAVIGAPVTDTFPASLTVGNWTCAATAGSSCTAAGSGSARTGTVTLLSGGSATFTATTTLAASAAGTLANTATVAAPSGITDPTAANNSATDTDTIAIALPTVSILDNFNRANATTLGGGWNQPTNPAGAAAIRVNGNQAFAIQGGQANRSGAAGTFGAHQAAAFTFVQLAGSPATPLAGSSLLLKVVNGAGTPNNPAAYIRVEYRAAGGGLVLVRRTANGQTATPNFTTLGTFPAAFAIGDTLTAAANPDGSVDVWRNTTYLGRSSTSASTGTGRVGIQLPADARVDNFRGGTLP